MLYYEPADVDECSVGEFPCSENANCTNTLGNYSCKCNDGFDGDGILCEGNSLIILYSHQKIAYDF